MKITFILPGPGCTPVGGYKVIYEYANRLAKLGNEVTVVHPARLKIDEPMLRILLKSVRYLQRRVGNSRVDLLLWPGEGGTILSHSRLRTLYDSRFRNTGEDCSNIQR